MAQFMQPLSHSLTGELVVAKAELLQVREVAQGSGKQPCASSEFSERASKQASGQASERLHPASFNMALEDEVEVDKEDGCA